MQTVAAAAASEGGGGGKGGSAAGGRNKKGYRGLGHFQARDFFVCVCVRGEGLLETLKNKIVDRMHTYIHVRWRLVIPPLYHTRTHRPIHLWSFASSLKNITPKNTQQSLPLKVKRSIPILGPVCPRCDGAASAVEGEGGSDRAWAGSQSLHEERQQQGQQGGRGEAKAVVVVRICYRFVGGGGSPGEEEG